MKSIPIFFTLLLVSCQQPTKETESEVKTTPPNIVLIIADDMGYSDLSYFGGEVPTPNIDAIFEGGTRLNQFYVSPSCSPTRAMLLSGADNHQVGLGTMIESIAPWQKGKPGHEGHLQPKVVTFAEVLKDNGYNNYLTGKWHLGIKPGQYPTDQGFHQSYAMLNGNTFHDGRLVPMPEMWKKNIDPKINHVQNGKPIDFPSDSYTANFYTDKMLEFIDNGKKDNKPFLAYLSLTAPHFPLQAPKEYMDKYKGKYDQGYQAIAQKRLAILKEKGMVDKEVQLNQIAKLRPWKSLSEKEQKVEAKKMETLAAMIHNMDDNVGKLIGYLKKEGLYENSVILFFADNGPSAIPVEKIPQPFAFDNSLENIGSPSSFIGLGPNWASISALPFKGVKGSGLEGSIRGVAAIKLPNKTSIEQTNAMIHVTDVYPTLLELANIKMPSLEGGQTVTGKSFLPILHNESKEIRTSFGMELSHAMANARAFRKGDFKLVWVAPPPMANPGGPKPKGKWKLFNLKKDPSETTDLAAEMPDKMQELMEGYNQYAMANGVVTPPKMPIRK